MPPPFDPSACPEYCCCILQGPDGSLLLERRPVDATRAGGLLTCYGGRRDPDEEPEACIRRELLEELGWQPGEVAAAVVLLRRGRPLAWFYWAAAPSREEPLRPEAGHEPVWVKLGELGEAPLSPWHRRAIEAFLEGRGEAVCAE